MLSSLYANYDELCKLKLAQRMNYDAGNLTIFYIHVVYTTSITRLKTLKITIIQRSILNISKDHPLDHSVGVLHASLV